MTTHVRAHLRHAARKAQDQLALFEGPGAAARAGRTAREDELIARHENQEPAAPGGAAPVGEDTVLAAAQEKLLANRSALASTRRR